MKKFCFLITLTGLVFLSLFKGPSKLEAQDDWTQPFRLSTEKGAATEATLLADDYGNIHAFWSEYVEEDKSLIQYSRFDGTNWTVPNDVYISREFIVIANITAKGSIMVFFMNVLRASRCAFRPNANNKISGNF